MPNSEELAASKAAARDKRRYIRISHDGSSCVMEPREAEAMLREEPGIYSSEDVWMTVAQFEALPEFGGW